MEPTVVFVYDDGPLADFEDVYPVHRRFGAPACVACVADWIGDAPGPISRLLGRGTTHLNADHVRRLDEAGWEVLSHGAAHRPLDAAETTAPVAADDRLLPVDTDLHARVSGDGLVVEEGEHETTVTVEHASYRPDRTALVLRDPVGESFPEGATVRYAESVVERELRDSKQALEAIGVEVDNVALPYSRYGPTARAIVPEVYDAVANAAVGGLNVDPTDPYDLRRQYLGRDALTDEQLDRFLRTVRDRRGLALFGGHSHRHVDPERVADALKLAEEYGIRVATLREVAGEIEGRT